MASPPELSEKLETSNGLALKSASVNTRKPPAGIAVPSGMRNFLGAAPSSLRNQPPRFTSLALGLNNSIQSSSGRSVCVSASFTRTGRTAGSGSSAPGEPPAFALARQ